MQCHVRSLVRRRPEIKRAEPRALRCDDFRRAVARGWRMIRRRVALILSKLGTDFAGPFVRGCPGNGALQDPGGLV